MRRSPNVRHEQATRTHDSYPHVWNLGNPVGSYTFQDGKERNGEGGNMVSRDRDGKKRWRRV